MPLKKVRKEIDKLDKDLLKILKKRKSLITKVAQIKKKHKLPLVQKAREADIDKKLSELVEAIQLFEIDARSSSKSPGKAIYIKDKRKKEQQ